MANARTVVLLAYLFGLVAITVFLTPWRMELETVNPSVQVYHTQFGSLYRPPELDTNESVIRSYTLDSDALISVLLTWTLVGAAGYRLSGGVQQGGLSNDTRTQQPRE